MNSLFGFLLGLNASVSIGLLFQMRQLNNITDYDKAVTRNKLRKINEELSAITLMVNHKNTADNIAAARRKRGGM